MAKKPLPPAKSSPSSSGKLEIYEFRGQQVVLDHEVAKLFGVATKRLNEQVARNQDKFLDDFAFRLTSEEFDDLKSRSVAASDQWGGTRYPPRVFTEHGVVMVATVLKSPRAIQATRFVVKTFVEARHQRLLSKRSKAGAAQRPPPLGLRSDLMSKINSALGHVLDAIVGSRSAVSARGEAKAIAAEGLKSIKDYLKTASIQNEKTLVEIRKIVAEAESIEVATAGKRAENRHRELALLAKKLRLVLQAQHHTETGSVEGLLQVLKDLEKP
ncbi:ORF6N domain-containing protein [Hyphomicrobium sp. CS1GBMeth3]|uniref:ORF6N domain-containing protein n=1 Tax=Hyphomicrobium sp. CS1GBMeth3 TaxID=1892845 RepID=UPI000930BBD3|nr:ORF6N domain-containing protein [Hyphomicrobium sp. CS1GBMeth3]